MPIMYTISDDGDRSGGPSGRGQGQRPLPVLFHLMDVSRPRTPAVSGRAEPAAADVPAAAAQQQALPSITPPVTSTLGSPFDKPAPATADGCGATETSAPHTSTVDSSQQPVGSSSDNARSSTAS